jgi:hypothetical protein
MDESVERRLRFWEDKINSFRIAGQGLKGGFPKTKLESGSSQEDRVAELMARVAAFTLAPDAAGVQVQGSMRDGFAVKSDVT